METAPGGVDCVMALFDVPTRLAFRTLNRVVRPLVEGGCVSPPVVGGGLVLLETTGRISGVTRQVPLAATRVGDDVFVSTVRSDSQWVRNLEHDPAAGVWIGGERRPARASVRRGPLNVVRLGLTEQPDG